MRQSALMLLPLLILTAVLSGCAGLPPPFGPPGVEKVVVRELPPEPTAVVCTPLPEGMALRATPLPPRGVLVEAEGLQPGERVTLIYRAEAPGRSSELAGLADRPAGPDGRLEQRETAGLSPLPGAIENRWEIKLVHQRGVACTEVVLPLLVGGGLILTGYDLSEPGPTPGKPLLVTLYWRAEPPPGGTPVAFARLVGPDGRSLAEDKRPLDLESGRAPTASSHLLTLQPGAAGDHVTLVAGWYDLDTGARREVIVAPLWVRSPSSSLAGFEGGPS